jgi:hypothetical protein
MGSNIGSAPATPGEDHRRAHRQRTLKQGKVVLSDHAAIDCTIRDLTPEGARLVFGGETALPQEFRLFMPGTGSIVRAKLLWQRGLSAGIAFAGPEESAASLKL